MVDYISVTQDVRELAGSVVPSEFPDTEIQEEQKAAYNYISIYTHKYDWDTDDPEFLAIQKLEAQLAKCFILEHYGGPGYAQIIDAQMNKINKALDAIKDNMITVSPDEGETITRTDYKSWVLNPDIPYESKLDQSLRADSVGTLD
jgi:hypothetical protein